MENITEKNGQSIVNVNVSAGSKNGGKGVNKYVGAVKEVFNFISKLPGVTIAKVAFVLTLFLFIILSFFFAYKTINSEEFIMAFAQKIEENSNSQEEAKLLIRTNKVTPKIQRELGMLCYSLNADRAFLFELHNGKRNASGLPFRYADMSYEETNEEKNVESVAMQFQDIPLTLYKYPHYLAEHRYIYGSVKEIAEVDNSFAKHIDSVGGKYLGMIYLTSRGLPLGFLCVSFHEEPFATEEIIKYKLEQYGKVITPLLDLNAQLKNDE